MLLTSPAHLCQRSRPLKLNLRKDRPEADFRLNSSERRRGASLSLSTRNARARDVVIGNARSATTASLSCFGQASQVRDRARRGRRRRAERRHHRCELHAGSGLRRSASERSKRCPATSRTHALVDGTDSIRLTSCSARARNSMSAIRRASRPAPAEVRLRGRGATFGDVYCRCDRLHAGAHSVIGSVFALGRRCGQRLSPRSCRPTRTLTRGGRTSHCNTGASPTPRPGKTGMEAE